jgi:hypothetical protein
MGPCRSGFLDRNLFGDLVSRILAALNPIIIDFLQKTALLCFVGGGALEKKNWGRIKAEKRGHQAAACDITT